MTTKFDKCDEIINIRNRKNNRNFVIEEKEVDSIVFQILKEFQHRSAIGYEKYNADLDRNDLDLVEWIQHAKEEHMDSILYLEKIRQLELQRLESNSANEYELADHLYLIKFFSLYSVVITLLFFFLTYIK